MDAIRKLWSEHQAASFPKSLGGVEIRGIDLVSLDADAAGCISTFLSNNGTLDKTRRAVLEVSGQNLLSIEAELQGEARAYFARLRRMTQETLRYLPGEGG